jgi:hypothetical protein
LTQIALRIRGFRLAGGVGFAGGRGGVGGTLHALNAAGNMPEYAQSDEHEQRRDETVLGEHLPLILIFEKTVNSL